MKIKKTEQRPTKTFCKHCSCSYRIPLASHAHRHFYNHIVHVILYSKFSPLCISFTPAVHGLNKHIFSVTPQTKSPFIISKTVIDKKHSYLFKNIRQIIALSRINMRLHLSGHIRVYFRLGCNVTYN